MISLETLLVLSGGAIAPYLVVAAWDWLSEERKFNSVGRQHR